VKIGEMLKQEVKKTSEFRSKNYSTALGDDYPEVVNEVIDGAGDFLIAQMAIDLMRSSMVSPERMLKQMNDGLPYQIIVKDNQKFFEIQLQMLYWGIQIGRRLEREQQEVLRKMETKG